MNRSTTFWRLAVSLIVVLFTQFTTPIAATPTTHLLSASADNLQDVSLFAARKTARIGDLITIEVTTGGFVDVDNIIIPITWNPALLSFNGGTGFTPNLTGFTSSNVNSANASLGTLVVNWSGTATSITDGMPFFTLKFVVVGNSATPATVSFTDIAGGDQLTIHTLVNGNANVTRSNGSVRILPQTCPSRPAGLSCQTAPILSASEFPYVNRLPTFRTIQTAPVLGTVCNIQLDNNQWVAFVAASTSIDVKMSAFSCGLQGGLQYAIYKTTDCVTFQRVDCVLQVGNNSEWISSLTGLTIGTTYYIMIDGYSQDVCSYVISVSNGQVNNVSQTIPNQTITGPSAVCGNPNGLTYSIPTVANADFYQWRLPSSATPTTPISGVTQTTINVNWGNVNDSVCVRIAARCDTTKWFCKSVKVGTPAATTINITKCAQAPYFFKGANIYAAGDYKDTLTTFTGCDSIVTLRLTNTPAIIKDTTVFKCAQDPYRFGGVDRRSEGDYTVTLATAAGCDSTINLHLFNYPVATKSIDTTICSGTSIIIGGRTFNAPYNSTVNVTRGSSRGCDSTINLKVTVIDFLLQTPLKNNDITCSTPTSTLTADVRNLQANTQVTYEWKNSSNTVIGTTNSVTVNQAGTFTLAVTVKLNGISCTKSTTVAVTKSGNQPVKPTVSGPLLGCIGTSEIYTLTPVANATSYNWAVSNGTFSTQINQITATWNASATNSKVCVNAQNACGTSDTACVSVEIGRIPGPLSITGSTTVCPNATITYRVVQAPNTTLLWSVTGGTAQNALNTDSLWVRWATTTGLVTVTPTSRCGSATPTNLNVQVSTTLPDSLPIQGIATACSNDTSTFTVASSATTLEYAWQVPIGATVVSGQGTRTIRVAWGSFSGNGQVFLTTKNACQLARGVDFSVNIKNAAMAAPIINGSRTVCPSTQISFSTPRNADIRSYTWTVPANAVILRGPGTDSIRVDWNISPSGQVCLEVENNCGVRTRTCINVDVRADLDSLVITGNSIVCKDSILRFCVPDDGSTLRFLWQIPTITGGTIVSGQGTSCIDIKFASTSGTVRVTPVGGCSDGKLSRKDIVVKLPPTIVGSITGKNTVCTNAIETYSLGAQTDVLQYKWGLPTGMTFIGDSTGSTITVNISNTATSGFLTVRGLNGCGLGGGTTLRVTVVPRPLVNAGADTSVCGKTFTLNGSANGTTKTWTVLSKPTGSTAFIAFFDRSQTALNVTKSGTYSFKFEEINGADCGMADTINITFRDLPVLTLIDQNCSQEATDYRVQLTISGSATQYSIGGSAFGTLVGSTFLSSPILSGSSYFFIATDDFGCKSDTFKGSKICPCYTSSGTLRADSLVVCYGATSKVTPLGDAKLDANDVSEYVLHNGTSTRIGAIFMRNRTGLFTYDPAAVVYNRVYYVSFVVGDQDANGGVDTSKRCVSWSRGVPIVFKDKITASLTGDTTVCRFSLVSLKFQTNQTGLFTITYQPDSGAISVAQNLQNNSYVNANPSVSATYRMLTAIAQNGCKAQITDSARVNLRPLPTANAGPDRSYCTNQIQLDAAENFAYKGRWTSQTPGVRFVDSSDARTVARGLQNGRNVFVWTVQDTACLDYSVRDTVQIFLPLLPKAVNLSLITYPRVAVNGNVTESAPVGTYSVTRLTNPEHGRFELFSSGAFTYIPDSSFVGIVKFRYTICSDLCTQLCDTGEVRILIKPREDTVRVITLDVPNAITPNDDGKNDALVIDGLDKFSENELVIFNRWGDVLYKSKPYQNNWRGTNQSGESLPEGTYYYVLRLNTADGKILRGDMTILR